MDSQHHRIRSASMAAHSRKFAKLLEEQEREQFERLLVLLFPTCDAIARFIAEPSEDMSRLAPRLSEAEEDEDRRMAEILQKGERAVEVIALKF